MPFLSPAQTRELATFALSADRETRGDAAGCHIRNEDDYTSNFTGGLRRIVNSNSLTGLSATSYLLEPTIERATGTDAVVIITRGHQSKIALFEAKLPRLAGSSRWDYSQTSTGLSHYSDQLERQNRLRKDFAIFEMFYSAKAFGAQPSWMQRCTSSCVWHNVAFDFAGKRSGPGPWSDQELEALLRSQCLNIAEILTDICACTVGQPISMSCRGDLIAAEFLLEGEVLQITSGEPQEIHEDWHELAAL